MKTLIYARNVATNIINTRDKNTPLADLLAEAFCHGYVVGRQGPTLDNWDEAATRYGIEYMKIEDLNTLKLD